MAGAGEQEVSLRMHAMPQQSRLQLPTAPSAAPPPNNPYTCDSRLGEVVESRQVSYLLFARLRSSTFPDTHACVCFPPKLSVSCIVSVVMYQKKGAFLG